jgi:hypothetical protein
MAFNGLQWPSMAFNGLEASLELSGFLVDVGQLVLELLLS